MSNIQSPITDGQSFSASCAPTTKISTQDFKTLLERLHHDPERAWELYAELRQKLVLYFGRHGHSFLAAELAEEVLDEIANKPDSQPIEDVMTFAFGVARNVQLRIPRRSRYEVPMPNAADIAISCESPADIILRAIDRRQKLKCFLECLRQMSYRDRISILEYYPAESEGLEERREKLAKTLGIDIRALRTRMFRLRNAIVKCVASRTSPR